MKRDQLSVLRYSLYFVGFANYVGRYTLITLLPTYVDRLQPSGIALGLFVTGLTIAQGVAVIPLGWAGDRFNKQRILLGSVGVSAMAYAMFLFIDSSAGFIGARFLQGLGIVGVGTLSLALISEITPVEARASTIGKYNSWKLAGGILGTLGTGAVFDFYGLDVVFGLVVGLMVVALISTWRYSTQDTSSVGFAFGDLGMNRRVLTMATFRSQYAFGLTLIRNWVPIFVGVSAAQGGLGLAAFLVGVVIASENIANMICQPFFGRLSDRHGQAMFIFIGGGLYGVVALAIPFAPALGAGIGLPVTYPYLESVTVPLLIVIGLSGLLGVAEAIREPPSMALFGDIGSEEGGVTSSFGLRDLIWKPGSIIAPMIGGVVMVQFGIEWVFYIGSAFTLTGTFIFAAILFYDHGLNALTEW